MNEWVPDMHMMPGWAQSMTSEACFIEEQAQLGKVWNFLGFQHQVPKANDWFTTTLGGRSVMVQRFDEGLRAFENICPHRFHPIRTVEQGNGPMVCGFHQWRFNDEGRAAGIPKCEQVFGKPAREMGACLNKVTLETCGGLIFGRFGDGPTLKEWLGPGYEIIEQLTANIQKASSIELSVKSHWKTLMGVSLDDYHIVAVHPTTFGKDGFLPIKDVQYYRFGQHSAFIPGGDSASFGKIATLYREKQSFANDYIILQLFPTFLFLITRAKRILGDDYWFVMMQQMIPEAHDHTVTRTFFSPLPFARPAGLFRKAIRWYMLIFVKFFFGRYVLQIHQEDNAVCENIQRVSHQIGGDMMLSKKEERIGWFEETYAKFVKLDHQDQKKPSH